MTPIWNLVKFCQLTQILERDIHRYVFVVSSFPYKKKAVDGYKRWSREGSGISTIILKIQSCFITPFSLVGIKTKEKHSLSAVRDSSVGTAIRDGLDGLRIESQFWRDLLQPSRPTLGPNRPTMQMGTGLIPGVKGLGRGAEHPPHLPPRLKKE